MDFKTAKLQHPDWFEWEKGWPTVETINRGAFLDTLSQMSLSGLLKHIETNARLIGMNWGNGPVCRRYQWYIDRVYEEARRRENIP